MLKSKIQTVEVFNNALEFFANNDDGRIGKAYEIALRKWAQPNSVRIGVTPAESWYGDMRAKADNKWIKIEIKTACGEIGNLPSYADSFTINDIVPKADYVVYCPEVCDTIAMEKQGFIFTRSEFIEMLTSYKGKRGGSTMRLKTATSKGRKIAIQSFWSETRRTANKGIADHIWAECYDKPTFEEWWNNRV